MSLLEECLAALGSHAEIIKNPEKNTIVKKLTTNFPPTKYGRIDWNTIEKKRSLQSVDDILPTLTTLGKKSPESLYVIWYDSSLPAVKTTLEAVAQNIDDVTAVSFDTWLYCPADGWVVEFYHDGEIIIGFA